MSEIVAAILEVILTGWVWDGEDRPKWAMIALVFVVVVIVGVVVWMLVR